MMQQTELPDQQEYKKQQTGILATMIPQIMNAMGGGDPYVQKALQQQQQQYENRIMQNNLRGFMRSVAMPGTGEITPDLIMEQAQAWDVPADMAMQAIMQFQAFRKANQAEKQKYSRVLPNGAVNTFEALPTDPNVQGEGIFPGEISNMPGPPALTETYNPDGTATLVPKVAGATITPKPTQQEMIKVPDGRGGWKIVPKVAGQSGMENPRSPLTTVNINTGEGNTISKEANTVLGKKLGESVQKRYQQAEEAVNQNAQLDQVALAMANGANTGMGEETILNIKSLAKTFGFDVGDLSGQELIRKVSNEMALRLRNPESGLGLTGNTSNKDLDFLKASVLGLARTEEGNLAIIQAMKRYNQLRLDMAKEQDRLIEENGGNVPRDLNSKILSFVNNYDLFTPEERQKIDDFVLKGSLETKPSHNKGKSPSEMTDDEIKKALGLQ